MERTRDNQHQEQKKAKSGAQQQRQQEPGGASAAGKEAVDPKKGAAAAPSKAELAKLLKAGLKGYSEGAEALAAKLAAEGTQQSGVDNLMSNHSELYSQAIAAWRKSSGSDQAFVKRFNKDPIATQKLADIDAEAYYEGNIVAARQKFYAAVADAVQQTLTPRDRLYPVLRAKADPFKFKGTRVPQEKLSAMSRRTHGVGSLHKYALSAGGQKLVSDFVAAEVAAKGPPGAPPAPPDPAEISGATGLQALKRMLRTSHAGDARPFANKAASLARAETWYSPAEVSVRPADPDLAFADMMTVGALQPEWYADGAIDLTVEPKGIREARKPTAFDGLMSSLWAARNQPGQTYGVTGGGAREFLEKGVTWGDAKAAVPVIPSDGWSDELNAMTQAVKDKGLDSSVGEELLRGKDPGVNKTQGAYEQVFDRTMQEAHSPSEVAGQAKPGAAGSAVSGGTFDAGRSPAPKHTAPSSGGAGAAAAPTSSSPGAASAAAKTGASSKSGGSATVAKSSGTSGAPKAPKAPPSKPSEPSAPVASTSKPKAETQAKAPESDPGVKAAEKAGTTAKSAPAGATSSVESKPEAPEAKPDVSKHAVGAPPSGWQARVVGKVPSSDVMPDDPGHTYHLLDDGAVVATTTPSLLPPMIAARVGHKLHFFNQQDSAKRAERVDADLSKCRAISNHSEYSAMISSMDVLVSPRSRASVALRVGKLNAAITRARGVMSADQQASYIDERIALSIPSINTEFDKKRVPAAAKLKTAAEAKEEDMVDAAECMKNFAAAAPEEPLTKANAETSKGIMKVFDLGEAFTKGMADNFKNAWIRKYVTEEAATKEFVSQSLAKSALVIAPAGEENKTPFKGKGPGDLFTNAVYGFVGEGKEAAGVSSYAEAIDTFALNKGYYPSKAMWLCTADAGAVKSAIDSGVKMGKPSMFNLLHFDENLYNENDRAYGNPADAADPTQLGAAKELTVVGFPGRDFWNGGKLLR